MSNNPEELLIKAQILAAIETIDLAQSPQDMLNAFAQFPTIKGASRSVILMFDQQDGNETATVVAQIDNRSEGIDMLGHVYTRDTLPMLWGFADQPLFLVENVAETDLLDEAARTILQYTNIQSIIALPLESNTGSRIGLLLVQSDHPRTYPQVDIDALQTVSQHLANNLQQQRLMQSVNQQSAALEQEREQLRLLSETTTQLETATDIDGLLKIISTFSADLGALAGLSYLLADDTDDYFYCSTGQNHPPTFYRQINQAISSLPQRSIVLSDLANNPEWYAMLTTLNQDADFNAVLVSKIPPAFERADGFVMYAFDGHQEIFDWHIQLVETVTNQAIVSLKNIFLVQGTQHALEQSQFLLSISADFFAHETPHDIYQTAVTAFIKAGVDRCSVGLFSEYDADNRPSVSTVAAVDGSTRLKSNGHANAIALAQTFQLSDYPNLVAGVSGLEPLVLNDTSNLRDFTIAEREFLNRIGAQSVVILPLYSFDADEPIGYIFLEYLRPHAVSPQAQTLFQSINNYIALALKSAEQLERTRDRAKQLETGAKISRASSQILDESTLMQEVVEQIKDGFNLYYVGLFVVDEARKWAVLRAGTGTEGEAQLALNHRLGVDEGSMIGWSVVNKQPRIAYDVGKDAVRFKNPHLPHTRSELAMPLISRWESVGALTIQSTEPAAFSDENIATWRIMADQLANALVNARLYQAVQVSAQSMSTLLTINRDLLAETTLNDLLQTIVDNATQVVNGDQGTVMLLEDNGQTLVPRAVSGQFEDEFLSFRIPIDTPGSISAQAVRDRQTITSSVDPQTIDEAAQIPGTPAVPEVLIATPLQSDTQVVGVLLIRRLQDLVPFDMAEKDLLEGIAGQAVLAVQNTNLLDQTRRATSEINELYQFSRQLASVEDTTEAAQLALGRVPTTALDRILVVLKDYPIQAEGEIWVENVAAWDKADQADKFIGNRFSSTQVPLITIEQANDLLLVNDFNDHDLIDENSAYVFTQMLGVKSAMIVPIKAANRVLGWLFAETITAPRQFVNADALPMLGLMDQLGGAVDRIYKTQDLQRRAAQFETIAQIGQSASATLDLSDLFNRTVNLIKNRFNFYYAGLFLLDEKREWAVLQAGSGEPGRKMLAANHRLRRDPNSMVGWATYYEEALVAQNASEEEHRFNNPHLPLTNAEIALPLFARGRVIGALDVQSVERNAFSPDDITTFQLLANQLANIIENARLFEQSELSLDRARMVYQTTQTLLASTSENTLFKLFVQSLQSLDVDTISVNLYGTEADERYYRVVEIWDRNQSVVYPPGTRLSRQQSILFDLFSTDETVVITNTLTDPRLDSPEGRAVSKAGVYALVGLPIVLNRRSQGVVVISSKKADRTFSNDEVQFFERLVQQLAITWQNVRLLNSVEKNLRRERVIRQLTTQIHGAIGVENILQTTVQGLTHALDAPGGVVRLGVKE